MTVHQGGCLCGKLRFEVTADPVRVSYCHCRFCQRSRGGPYMVEPIFSIVDFKITRGAPKVYDHTSEGSGKMVHLHFCDTCASATHLSFERFDDFVGVHAGTFDDPNWFHADAENAKHIFLDVARDDTVIPAGLPTYRQHATDRDGNPQSVTVYVTPKSAKL